MTGRLYPRRFEIINGTLERLRVPGGWLVHNVTTIVIGDRDVKASECFAYVPDPGYEWILEEK